MSYIMGDACFSPFFHAFIWKLVECCPKHVTYIIVVEPLKELLNVWGKHLYRSQQIMNINHDAYC